MSILSISNVSKTYGVQPVLNQVSLTLGPGQRVGLVGANGVGKSTLLKIIVGEIEADSEPIRVIRPGTQVGYLPQAIQDFAGKTVDDLIAEAQSHLHELAARLRALEQLMTGVGPDQLASVMDDYAEVTEQFERYGGYEVEYRVDAVLGGLGVGQIPRGRRVASLSGGEKARLSLAMLLLQAPDVLLLDEPTNHLDLASLGWLEDYLRGYRGAMLIVSHDRQFLNRTVNAILEIEEHSRQAKHYAGDYDAYLEARELERCRWQEDYERQQETIKTLRQEIKTSARQVAHNRAPKDNDKFLKGFKQGRVAIAVARRVHSAEEQLERILADPIPKPPEDLCFAADFDPSTLKGHYPLAASGLSKAFGGRRILDDVTFAVNTRSRIALVGPNGAGKSTLLKLLAGLEAPDGGEVYINPQVRIGYLDQEQETLIPDQTVFETYRAGLPAEDQPLISALIGSGLFRYEELGRKIRELSSGQKRKLQIARLIAERANCLLLDEPTNYVSFDILEALETALRAFPGPVIAVSHDRRFLGRFGAEIWELRGGKLMQHQDGLAMYLASATAVAASHDRAVENQEWEHDATGTERS